MIMGITHKWNGSILTITSDSGTSSMDLQGPKGNKGCRGPQGRAGCIVNPDGTVDMTGYVTEAYVDEKILEVQLEATDLSNYYTKEQTIALIDNVDVDVDLTDYAKKTDIPTNVSELTNDAEYATKFYVDNKAIDMDGYATEEYVSQKIAEAQLEGAEVDLSLYATKSYVDDAVENVDLTGYATEEYVDSAVENVDLTGYATEQYVTNAISGIDFINVGVGRAGTGENAEVFNIYEGDMENIASGNYSHAEGRNTIADGNSSHAEGIETTASGIASHAEGYHTTASGIYGSHAEGYETNAIGYGSHAEGYSTEAVANYSHAEGYNTRAIGLGSHVEGRGTISEYGMQHVEGEYNAIELDSHRLQYGAPFSTSTSRGKYVHIVGNGTSDTERSNCHTLDWDGNAWFAGKVYVGGTSMDDAVELGTGGGSADLSDYATKEYVQEQIATGGSAEVYIGTAEPTDENIKLWVDTDAESSVVTVDVLESYIGDIDLVLDAINGEVV